MDRQTDRQLHRQTEFYNIRLLDLSIAIKSIHVCAMSSDFVIITDVLIFNRNQNNRSVNVPLRSLKVSRDTNEREPIYCFANG